MSIEKYARRALWRLVFWRLIGELCVLPQLLLRGIVGMLQQVQQWFRNLEMAVFYMEIDAARRYKLLTGLDLGTASGEPGRYGASDPQIAEGIQQQFFGGGEDDD